MLSIILSIIYNPNPTYHLSSSLGCRFLACSEENKEKMTQVIEALCKCVRILVSIVLPKS